MPLPYENSTSGKKAVDEIEKILRKFGASSFAYQSDFASGDLTIHFQYKDRPVKVQASAKGYAAAWLREHPWSSRSRSTRQEHDKKALEIGSTAIYSMLRDWLKGQVTAIETGILSFEGAFLGQLLLPNGQTFMEKAEETKLLALKAPDED